MHHDGDPDVIEEMQTLKRLYFGDAEFNIEDVPEGMTTDKVRGSPPAGTPRARDYTYFGGRMFLTVLHVVGCLLVSCINSCGCEQFYEFFKLHVDIIDGTFIDVAAHARRHHATGQERVDYLDKV